MAVTINFEESDFTAAGLLKCKMAIAEILDLHLEAYEEVDVIWDWPSPLMIAEPSIPDGYMVNGTMRFPK